MHIPRQSHGSRGAQGVRVDAAAGLRARRRDVVGELRTVAYWQRLVQARTDLCVAGLLYAAPARPVAPSSVPAGALRLDAPPVDPAADDVDLASPAAPPAGLELGHVLGGHAACESTGAHLDGLREAALALGHRSRALREELDRLTVTLHAHQAGDGAEVPTEVTGVATGAGTPHPA